MRLREYRRQSGWAIAFRALATGLGLVLTYLLLSFAAWHAVGSMSSSDPPSPEYMRERYFLLGSTVACLVGTLLLALGPLAARLSPVLGYVPVAIYVIIAMGLMLVEGSYEISLPFAAFAALAWWLRR
jgi:hypothetical protein